MRGKPTNDFLAGALRSTSKFLSTRSKGKFPGISGGIIGYEEITPAEAAKLGAKI